MTNETKRIIKEIYSYVPIEVLLNLKKEHE